jgi:hypothetical protein
VGGRVFVSKFKENMKIENVYKTNINWGVCYYLYSHNADLYGKFYLDLRPIIINIWGVIKIDRNLKWK